MNNAVVVNGKIRGFRCYECRGVFDAMWGETCNACREKERRHKEMLAAMSPAPKQTPKTREALDARAKEIRAEIDRLHAEQDAIDREIERIELAEQAA